MEVVQGTLCKTFADITVTALLCAIFISYYMGIKKADIGLRIYAA
jgi:hypothetical protein